MSGTRSTREESVQPASTGGLQRNVSLALAGRRIRIGMRSDNREGSDWVKIAL